MKDTEKVYVCVRERERERENLGVCELNSNRRRVKTADVVFPKCCCMFVIIFVHVSLTYENK